MKTYQVENPGSNEVVFSKPELACRFVETLIDRERPDGMTAYTALLDLKKTSPEVFKQVMAMADTASDYFLEICGVEHDHDA